MAINVEYFLDRIEFISKVDNYIDSIKNLKKVEGVTEIYLPGEIEFLKEEQARREGIELALPTLEKLNDILSKIGSSQRL